MLSGDDIPLEGRLLSLVDVYDALRSERPYKQAMTHEEAYDIIYKGRGTQFDPGLVDIFLTVSEQFDGISR
jgi:putative two-component system response regulator